MVCSIFFIYICIKATFMFKLVNKDAVFPPLYEHVEREKATVHSKGYDKVGDFVLRENVDLIPQEGLQENLARCMSNLIFICGEATSGKTFGMMLKALQGVGVYGYTARLINVRKIDSAKGTSMQRDGQTVWGNFSNCEVTTGELPTFSWPKWNNAIQFLHANFNADNPSEWDDFQETYKKQQSALFLCDEATALEQYKMFTYIFSRNRDSSGITPQTILAFNPKYEHWTTAFLLTAGYIGDDWHLKPDWDGRTRYFYVKGDEPEDVLWGDTKEEVVVAAGIRLNEEDKAAGLTEADMVKSFTLFTGHASGNRKLVNATGGQSVANLHNVGATQRAILAEAYFGPALSTKSSVTKQMILDLPNNPINDDENLYATMDISGAESDSDICQMVIWKGLRIIAIESYKGDMKAIVPWIEGKLAQYGVDATRFAFDATGMGFFLKSYINANPITANKTAIQEYDEQGNPVTFEQYFNVRSQLLGKTKVLFETGQISTSLDLNTRIPFGKKGELRTLRDILFDSTDLFISTTKNKRIYFLSKNEFKARHQKNSPDLMDSICLRAFFELDARPKKQPAQEIEDDAYNGLYQNYGAGRSVVWV